MKWDPHNVVEYLQPPHEVVGVASLKSFDPRRSSCPLDITKLTRRKASHFITTAIAAEEDRSEEEEERVLEEDIEDATSPGCSPL